MNNHQYAPQSNVLAKQLVQESWTKTRTILFASILLTNLWGEAMHHANWLPEQIFKFENQ